MSIKKEKIPIVRFKDFSEPWIKNQLSEVAEFSKGRGYSKKDLQSHGTPIILYGRLYTSYESVISNVETYANLEENSVVSEGGEVIIPASGESADDISRASCVIDRGIILGGDLNIVRPHEYLNSLFIAITLSNGSQQRELSKRAQGKSVVHLHNSDLKAVKLFYPSYEEQSAIGSLFRTLDDLLASYKDNLANYQSLKTTMLSKMFPKAGQTVPEIRLDGFEGEWEKYYLGDIFEQVSNYIEPSKKNELWSLTVEKGLTPKTDRYKRDFLVKKNDKFKKVDVQEFVYNPMNLTLGALDLNDNEVTISVSGYYVVMKNRNMEKFDNDFLKILLKTTYAIYQYKQFATGTLIEKQRVQFPTFSEIPIYLPPIAEQQAIGAYFSNLDNLINSYQDKISQLETLKKKLLQDMFI
ncbi:restriction endonuclease subunit S [Streptococcus thermophilus]|uniref:restriction endonuclease subunit S n=1 Tax=Streptococcus thermophilus TaxID=1308 RepID=UPI0022FF0577|nr:restriction endonuclease subunit S [Streptococcus thermophilus]MDA5519388.1 restriction endonuclease subunit S [Streptococcus thermophilus]MDW2956652.1 restriction endonuclease subunit S [Streptococcus thermophilus]